MVPIKCLMTLWTVATAAQSLALACVESELSKVVGDESAIIPCIRQKIQTFHDLSPANE